MRALVLRLNKVQREEVFTNRIVVWQNKGISVLGIEEGTVWDIQGARNETDEAIADANRDWVAQSPVSTGRIYFSHLDDAQAAKEDLENLGIYSHLEEVEKKDWDHEWKKHFPGIYVPPFWQILPPWKASQDKDRSRTIFINPGQGFGTGTHETTQLCLQELSNFLDQEELRGCQVLDVGSGSGILSIAAAIMGSQVIGVEIDLAALKNSEENLLLNSPFSGNLRFQDALPDSKHFHPKIIVANILKNSLLGIAGNLISYRPDVLILSGLLKEDLTQVQQAYETLSGKAVKSFQTRTINDWYALIWRF